MTYVLLFDDPRAIDVAVSGGKGANLARLTQAGFPVPPGFIISTAAFRGSAEALPRELVAEVESLCAAAGPAGRWAVRSSGTAEDMAGAAFAGQHDTFLNCTTVHDVLRRVQDCRASLWSRRAVAYRARMRLDESRIAMAVVVQQMVIADVAGVAFTIDPVQGRLDTVVIDANFGLGESVVSGESEVDHLVVERRRWILLSKQVATKSTRVVAAESGTMAVHVSGFEARRASLTDAQAIDIAKLAVQVEERLGWPQDIEWAIAGGQLVLLQSRPITAIPPRWTRDESAERFPNVVTPLTWDFVEEGFHRSLNHSFQLMGLPAYEGKWFASFGHYIYGNQNAVELYARRSPVPSIPLPELLLQLPSIVERFRWIADLPAQWHADLPSFLAEIDSLLGERIDGYDLPALWGYLERVNAAGTRYFLPNIAISIGHGVLHRALWALVSATTAEERVEEVCAALVACETMTTRVNQELRALATLAGETDVADDLLARSSRELWSMCSQSPSRFWTALREFLTRHGHRETDFDAYHPTWSEAPWVVLDHIRALLMAPLGAAPRASMPNADLQLQVIQRLPLEMRGLAARVIALAREYTALDDLEHYHTTRLSLPLRRGVRAIGRQLRRLGVVEEELDAFFARAESLRAAISGAMQMEVLKREVTATKADYLHARLSRPRWSLESKAIEQSLGGDDGGTLRGIPGSPGAADGIVHIVRGTDDFAHFPRGAVLVARTTNPAWTPLFYSAAAVVTESGGALSHGAVTAREMRIPAVMSVRGAVDRLHNGDHVRVNGELGTITIMSGCETPCASAHRRPQSLRR